MSCDVECPQNHVWEPPGGRNATTFVKHVFSRDRQALQLYMKRVLNIILNGALKMQKWWMSVRIIRILRDCDVVTCEYENGRML